MAVGPPYWGNCNGGDYRDGGCLRTSAAPIGVPEHPLSALGDIYGNPRWPKKDINMFTPRIGSEHSNGPPLGRAVGAIRARTGWLGVARAGGSWHQTAW